MRRTAEHAKRSGAAAALLAVAWAGLGCSPVGTIDIGSDDALWSPAPPLPITCTALSPSVVWYRAQKTQTLVPPRVPNLVAIAPGVNELWLMTTLWNSGTVSFYEYDPATNVAQQWSIPNPDQRIFATSGTGATGLEVDSRTFWVSLIGNDNSIVRIDRVTGAFARLPGVAAGGSSDLAWLNNELLASTATGFVYAVTQPPTWTPRKFFDASDAGSAIRQLGVAACGDAVVVAGSYNVLSVLDSRGVAMGQITSDEGDLFANADMAGPIAFYNDQLVVADKAGLEFYSLTPHP
jgi:hypothetical protein